MKFTDEERIVDVLLDYIARDATFPGKEMKRVPPEAYTDARVALAEEERIFKRLPLMVALSCELPNPGDYKAMEIAHTPIVVVRDKNERVRAFLNVCAHRWAPLVNQDYGTCSRLTCPFHGWTYALDGRLMGVADTKKFGALDKGAHSLRELPSAEEAGLIFLTLTPGGDFDPKDYFGPLLEEFAGFDLRAWNFLGQSTFEAANWKIVLTNFFESYHFAAQHPTTVAQHFISNLSHYQAFGPHMKISYAPRTIERLRDVPRAQWSGQAGAEIATMRYMFPNVTGTIYPGDISYFIQVLPAATPDTSKVIVLYLCREELDDASERRSVLERGIELSNAILRDEDFATGIATQRNLRSAAHAGLLYGLNERGPQYFHEWCDWYTRADPNACKPVL